MSIANVTGTVSRYLELVEAFPLRPIRSDERYNAAIVVMNSLLDIDRSEDEDDYLDVLGDLIHAYELAEFPEPRATQADILRALLEDKDATQADLATATGVADSNISAMLAGRRAISKANMVKFAKFFKVAPGRFLVK